MIKGTFQVSGPDAGHIARLMEQTAGIPDVAIGLIDGPVAMNHADLQSDRIRVLAVPETAAAHEPTAAARAHGTFVAGILSARRGTAAPAICGGCTLLVRPIFLEPMARDADTPSASPQLLADAIVDCLDAGARVVNLSVALARPSPNREPALERALQHAAARGTLVVAAAGNQGTVGGSAITGHPWVIPVVACSATGRPMASSNVGTSIARRGLMAPGDRITSLGTGGQPVTWSGTSAAAPFVTGAIALLWSLFSDASAADIKLSVTRGGVRRTTVVPPMLDAWGAYEEMSMRRARG